MSIYIRISCFPHGTTPFDQIRIDQLVFGQVLSFIVLIIVTMLIEVPAKFLSPMSDTMRYFIIGGMFNAIRIPALGIMIGYLYDKLNGRVRR